MVVVKWSAYSPSSPTILLSPIVFSVKFVFEMNQNKQKELGVGLFFKNRMIKLRSSFFY